MLGPILQEVLQQVKLREGGEGRLDGAEEQDGVTVSPTGTPRMLWSPEQWWEAFAFVFFWKGPGSKVDSCNDDLLFFVVRSECRDASSPPYFVRRKGQELPAEIQKGGPRFLEVDWCETFLLNLVLQSGFLLAVAVCSYQDVTSVGFADAEFVGSSARVTKKVYASPTRSTVNLGSTKIEMANPVPSYPDICFAVENFEDAFNSMVVSEADQHYCVMLFATDSPGLSDENLASWEDEEQSGEASGTELPGGASAGVSHELSNDSAFVFIPNPNTMQAVDDIQRTPRTPRQALQQNAQAPVEGGEGIAANEWEGSGILDNADDYRGHAGHAHDGHSAEGTDRQGGCNYLGDRNDNDGGAAQGIAANVDNQDPPCSCPGQPDKRPDAMHGNDFNDPPEKSEGSGNASSQRLDSMRKSVECADPGTTESDTFGPDHGIVKDCVQETTQQERVQEDELHSESPDRRAMGNYNSGSEGCQQPPPGPAIEVGIKPNVLEQGTVGDSVPGSKDGDEGKECASDGDSREMVRKALGLRLFGGYVGYEQIKVVLVGPSVAHPQATTVRRIRMKGPGGQGFAEVAVTLGIEEQVQEQQETEAEQPDQTVKLLKEGLKLGPKAFLQRGIGLATNSLKGAINKLRREDSHGRIAAGDAEYRLQCALMTLSLPVEMLALQILEAACSV